MINLKEYPDNLGSSSASMSHHLSSLNTIAFSFNLPALNLASSLFEHQKGLVIKFLKGSDKPS